MSFWTFLKSVPGKITMAVTTVAAGVGANFAGAAMVKDDVRMDAIKRGVVDGGGNIDGLSDAQISDAYEVIKTGVDNGTITDPVGTKIVSMVEDNLSQVDFQSHIQGLSIGLTIAAVVIVGVIWFLLYRKATKMDA